MNRVLGVYITKGQGDVSCSFWIVRCADQHGNPQMLSVWQCAQYLFLHHNVIIAIGVFCSVSPPPLVWYMWPALHSGLLHFCSCCQVIGIALLGFWSYHMWLVRCGKTTNETFKWEDLQLDLQDAHRTKHSISRKKSVKACKVALQFTLLLNAMIKISCVWMRPESFSTSALGPRAGEITKQYLQPWVLSQLDRGDVSAIFSTSPWFQRSKGSGGCFARFLTSYARKNSPGRHAGNGFCVE